MSDEQKPSSSRQNCCRLCLAPDNECISILNSYAADKEPLATKIYSCINIKITSSDRLSLRICHACISYLNSWQSFKNRCLTAQKKQLTWLEDGVTFANKADIPSIHDDFLQHHQQQQQQQQHQQQQLQQNPDDSGSVSGLTSSILEGISTLKKRKSLTVYPLPAVQIKDEPIDADDDYSSTKQHDESDDIVDPTMFLERTADEGDEPLMESTGFDYDSDRPIPQQQPTIEMRTIAAPNVLKMDSKEASCRACNLKFSTRANARRHERNLHPNLFDSLENAGGNGSNLSLNKQTAALNASLELQRAVAAAVAADACKLNTSGLISKQKYRQEVVNAFNNSEMGGWDYDNPEKYQQLLTDEKIVFLQQNEEFLQQYQTMTCRCCNKYYSTYKKFMAHMRKKYLTLPRNLCFNCLKLNDSKALFISHLKRRNCINLYKILKNLMVKNVNFASAVNATVAATSEKMRAKELLVNKMYECKLCPKTYRLKLEYRSHVYEEHADAQRKNLNPTQCKFCAVDIEDPAERKRHYNNMECICVLRCITCDTKHDNYAKFMEHVQEKHLPAYGDQPQTLINVDTIPTPAKKTNSGGTSTTSEEFQSRINNVRNATPTNSGGALAPVKSQCFSRMPQACPICGQQYNNYNNVLRHMESKHPDQLPQTYKCVKCGVGYPRLSNLRDHMVNAHETDKVRNTSFEYIVNAETVKPSSSHQSTYSGRYDYVMKDLMSITNGGTVDNEDGSGGHVSKKARLDNPTPNNGQKECPICKAVFNNNIGLSNHMRSHQLQNPMAVMAAKAAANAKANAANSAHPVQHAILKRTLEQAADRRFRRMRCRICQRRFSTKKSYRYHMFNDHQIRNVQFIKCQLCDAEFAYEKGLKVHMFKVHNTLLKDEMIIKQYECEICSIVYRTDVELQHHLANFHDKQRTDNVSGDIDDLINSKNNQIGAGGNDKNVTGSSGSGGSGDPASGISTPVGGVSGGGGNSTGPAPLYWYQCKYCPSNFNTNKKLAIHINSHDEFDSNDYSCKDCGNVYSGRKSLWVHRYKKHPQFAEPSECHMCKKVFFDAQMLEHHTPSCNRTPLKAWSSGGNGTDLGQPIYKHKTGDDEDDDDETSRDVEEDRSGVGGGNVGNGGGSGLTNVAAASNLKIKFPEVACTICGARFTDQELFTKHFQMHEMELYTDNPLASMFDTEPADPNQFYMDRMNENGEYACDLCTKTFTQMTAFKVHRKWHFRGDSKQNEADQHMSNLGLINYHQQIQSSNNEHSLSTISNHPHLLGLQAVGLMPRQSVPASSSISKSQKRKRELKCQYCPSTFISNNNLRRHLYELHKNEIGNLPIPPKIPLDPANTCRRCNLKFETKSEWIEHKVADARVMKPFGPFQWGCDLCGTYVSRKEKLINHIHNHMKEQIIVPVEQPEATVKGTSQTSSQSSQSQSQSQLQSQTQEHILHNSIQSTSITKETQHQHKQLQKQQRNQQFNQQQQQQQQQQQHQNQNELQQKQHQQQNQHQKSQQQQQQEQQKQQVIAQIKQEPQTENYKDVSVGKMRMEVTGRRRTSLMQDREEYDDSCSKDQYEEFIDEVGDEPDEDDEEEEEEEDEGGEEFVDEDIVDSPIDEEEADEMSVGAQQAVGVNDDDDLDGDGDDVEEEEADVEDDEDEDEEEVADSNEDTNHQISNHSSRLSLINKQQLKSHNFVTTTSAIATNNNATTIVDSDEFDDDDDDDDDEDDDDSSTENRKPIEIINKVNKSRYSCDLCQVFFDSQSDLQKHVKMHFLNGPGSVTLTEINKVKSSSSNKSRSSSSDIVT